MHMSDAFLSPAVGGAMLAASGGVASVAARRLRRRPDEGRVALMGVLGAFVFAAQMVNFAIPGTGSSGHLAGGLLLAILLGPHAAFLTMASVLAVQAFVFADGGLLALGCNLFNMGFCACYVAYPLACRPLVGREASARRLALGAVAGSVLALQLGALGVVVETALSGASALPLRSFALLLLPVHLAIGIAEGLVTGAVVLFLRRTRPELLAGGAPAAPGRRSLRPVLVGAALAAALVGGVVSWFASARPDGLEWSLARVGAAPPAVDRLHRLLEGLQAATALLPGYAFRGDAAPAGAAPWPAPSAGTTASGIAGALLTLGLAVAVGAALRLARRADRSPRTPAGPP